MASVVFLACVAGTICLVGLIVGVVIADRQHTVRRTAAGEQYLLGRLPVRR